VAKRLRLSWNAVDGIMQRPVRRGRARRPTLPLKRLSVDETAYRKGHDYVTVVRGQEEDAVVHVSDDRCTESLGSFYGMLTEEQKQQIEIVCMEMLETWPAYITATRQAIEGADDKIAFDRFHVTQYMSRAVDLVRRQEHCHLMRDVDERLKGSKYHWLRNPRSMSWHQSRQFSALRQGTLKTAQPRAMKELAFTLWKYQSHGWALKGWKRLLGWMARSRLKPMKDAWSTLKKPLLGIINAVLLGADNSLAVSINSRIKMIKSRARGFQNKERFRNAIYFHLGKL